MSRMNRYSVGCLVCTALMGALAMATSASASELPPYGGMMSFPRIISSSSPEDYSWRVELGEEMELKSIDESEAGVFFSDGTMAMSIWAPSLHDDAGSPVPTSLSVTPPDTITFSVHHLAGNPAAGGAPFVYPISDREKLDTTYTPVIDPNPTTEPPPPPTCHVPRLRNESLKAARKKLEGAHCALGRVKRGGGRPVMAGRVVKQFPRRGAELAAGGTVSVRLGNG